MTYSLNLISCKYKIQVNNIFIADFTLKRIQDENGIEMIKSTIVPTRCVDLIKGLNIRENFINERIEQLTVIDETYCNQTLNSLFNTTFDNSENYELQISRISQFYVVLQLNGDVIYNNQILFIIDEENQKKIIQVPSRSILCEYNFNTANDNIIFQTYQSLNSNS